MRRLLNIILVTLLFLNRILAQTENPTDHRVVFQGIIRDASSLAPLPNSQISVNRSFVVSGDSAGGFSLTVNRRDTMQFSHLGYKSVFVILNDSLPGKDYMTGIYLTSDTIQIGEVIIIPRLANLKSDLLNPRKPVSQEMENARNNLAIAAYQAKVSTGKLGDPASNYEVIRQVQRMEAYEKGQIPSSRIVGLSPLLLIPALYLMMNGLPAKPAPAKSNLTEEEINMIQKKYLESIKREH